MVQSLEKLISSCGNYVFSLEKDSFLKTMSRKGLVGKIYDILEAFYSFFKNSPLRISFTVRSENRLSLVEHQKVDETKAADGTGVRATTNPP